jgi:hypothetical protein
MISIKLQQAFHLSRCSIYRLRLAVILLTFFTGCKVLSKNEANSVQGLAKAMSTSADFQSEFIKQYYGIALETSLLGKAATTNPADKISELNEQLNFQSQVDTVITGYTAGFGILKKYAQLLLALCDDTYLKELNKQNSSFVPAFDTLVARYNHFNPGHSLPVASSGGLVSSVIDQIGSHRIGRLQRKYLKVLIDTANPIIEQITDEYRNIDFYKNNENLKTLDNTIDHAYKNFVKQTSFNDSSRNQTFAYYTQYDPIYLNWKNKLLNLSAFNQQSTVSMAKVKLAHVKLKEQFHKKASRREFLNNVQDLYASINALYESYEKFSNDLSSSKKKS